MTARLSLGHRRPRAVAELKSSVCTPSRTDTRTVALRCTSMLLTRFIPCVVCKRVVRVFDSRLRQTARSEVQLPEDGATSADDGTFACPFCGTIQRPAAE